MFSLVYKSEASLTFDKDAISKMLLKSQKSNAKQDITGCLLYHDGSFVQLLEGEKDIVKSLYKKIQKDSRHKNVTVLSMEESIGRIFETWHMIFAIVNDVDSSDQSPAIKRQLFDDIFHASNAVSMPGHSKLALWIQVNKFLNKHDVQSYVKPK